MTKLFLLPWPICDLILYVKKLLQGDTNSELSLTVFKKTAQKCSFLYLMVSFAFVGHVAASIWISESFREVLMCIFQLNFFTMDWKIVSFCTQRKWKKLFFTCKWYFTIYVRVPFFKTTSRWHQSQTMSCPAKHLTLFQALFKSHCSAGTGLSNFCLQ